MEQAQSEEAQSEEARSEEARSTAEPTTDSSSTSSEHLAAAQDLIGRLRRRLRAVIRGRDEVIDLVLIALLADGHVLLEDYPGSGKTTLARALGEAIVPDGESPSEYAPFRRIQSTPDLLPSDITGTSVFDLENNRFEFRRGPIFAHVVLADEINRTSPKVQAAMLEAMAEKQVTVDNTTHPLDELFFVIATQNPLDLAGTYPLPTPQLDRFLFKLTMDHIERDAELSVLDQYPSPSLRLADELATVTQHEVLAARRALRHDVRLDPRFKEHLVDLARALRADDRVLQGASTRSLVLMLPALQARALVHGRDFVSPEDLEQLAPFVFRHRLECIAGPETAAQVVRDHIRETTEKLARASMKR
jgi:MoxR-like ATPase